MNLSEMSGSKRAELRTRFEAVLKELDKQGPWATRDVRLPGVTRKLVIALVREKAKRYEMTCVSVGHGNVRFYRLVKDVEARARAYPHPAAPWPAYTRIPEALEAWALRPVAEARFQAAVTGELLNPPETQTAGGTAATAAASACS